MIFKMSATRYSKALFDVANEAGELEKVKADMQIVDTAFSEIVELKKFFLKSSTTLQNAKKSVEIVFADKISEKTKTTFMLMIKNRRVSSIPFMPLAFSKVCEENGEGVNVVAEFANSPDKMTVKKLRRNLEKRVGKIATLNIKEVPSLVGGFRIKFSNRILDNSVVGRLRELSQRLSAS